VSEPRTPEMPPAGDEPRAAQDAPPAGAGSGDEAPAAADRDAALVPSAADTASAPPWHHLRPIWELELLISGAVIFSLFQLPSLLSRAYLSFELHLSSRLFLMPFLLYYVVTLVVIALILAFSIHFFLRGFWVALCGLNTVFPEGVLWERFDGGPIARRVLRDMLPDPRELERRADRLASTVFSVLFLIVLSLFFGMLWMIALTVVSAAFARLVLPRASVVAVFYTVLAVTMLPLLTANAIDRWFKKEPSREAAHPRLARFAERTVRGYTHATFGRLYNPILVVFSTHFSTRRATFGSIFASVALVLLFLAYFVVRLGVLGFDSYVYFPTRPSPLLLRADHYESLRGEEGDRVSTIQSDVVEDPYVRLFIPYLPNRDRESIEEHCPDLEPLRGEGLFLAVRRRGDAEQAQAVADCLRRIYQVRLNGRTLELADLVFHRRASDGAVGVLVHLPTAAMPGGRNVLEIERAPLPGVDAEESEREEARRHEYLPFWR
jgi:hypothetical protein